MPVCTINQILLIEKMFQNVSIRHPVAKRADISLELIIYTCTNINESQLKLSTLSVLIVDCKDGKSS